MGIGEIVFIVLLAAFLIVLFVGIYKEVERWDANLPTHDSLKAQRDAVTAGYLRSIGEHETARKYER
jgi:hypothetical protein